MPSSTDALQARVNALAAGLSSAAPVADPAVFKAALLAVLDACPVQPSDPSQYPQGGGLYRNGDANGYTLVRILPTS